MGSLLVATTTIPETEAADEAASVPAPTEKPAGRRRLKFVKQPLPVSAAVVVQVLLVVASLSLWTIAYLVVIAPTQQARAQQVLYSKLREQVALATAPIGGFIPPGDPVAVLEIPGLGLREVVVEGTSSSDLMNGPGHRRDTPLPGQAGISIVYGRAATFGAPFGQVTALRLGDRITVITGQGKFTYRVDRVRRTGDPVPFPPQAGAGRLTLVTAEGEGRLSEISADETVYVDATLLDKAQPAPGGRPNIIPPTEKAMARDGGALVPLVLWLQGLAVALAAFVWARVRWGRRQTWLIGAPVVLALVWVCTEYAAQLLPNLL
jgi:sortase A